MTDSYEDAEPDETVFVTGQGNMALRAAVGRGLGGGGRAGAGCRVRAVGE